MSGSAHLRFCPDLPSQHGVVLFSGLSAVFIMLVTNTVYCPC